MRRIALITVSDKTGLGPFAQHLVRLGYTLLSTGGTHSSIESAGVPVLSVADYTGSREIMDGRVKTLHPKLYAGILAGPKHMADLVAIEGDLIDMVVVNLYPFQRAVAEPGCTAAQAIENIDIGGVSLLRAAAKNHERVTIVCSPADYDHVISGMDGNGNTTLALRQRLAAKAFMQATVYDMAIAEWFSQVTYK